jgi:hypothetical protein
MPDLLHRFVTIWGTCESSPSGGLRLVRMNWILPDSRTPRSCDSESMRELIETLPPAAQVALSALEAAGGRIPWAVFARQFGEVREMGAAKRDRDKPYLNPASGAEDLFYRALLGRPLKTGEAPRSLHISR